MAQNEFKALVFHEIAALHREIAEVRAPKLRKTELDTESTNSGSAASCGGFSSASADDEVFAPDGQLFCDAHAQAGTTVVCTAVVKRELIDGEEIVLRCNGKAVFSSGCRVCATCGKGSAIAESVAATAGMAGGTGLDRSLKRNDDALKISNNILGGFSTTIDPNHVAAWTKRRRL